MGILDFFTGRIEVVIKFDHETEQLERKTKAISLDDKDEPSVSHIGGEASGSLLFEPEMLSLREKGNERSQAEQKLQSLHSQTIFPVYRDGEDLKGTVFVKCKQGAGSIGHSGVKIEFLGQVTFPSALHPNVTFCSLQSRLAAEGKFDGSKITAFPFEFKHAELIHESYHGRHMAVKVTIGRPVRDFVAERCIWVQNPREPSQATDDNGWVLEIGLEEQLHIEFRAPKLSYSLTDWIEGQVEFLVSNLPLTGADLTLIRRECVGRRITEQKILLRQQIMDGPALKGDKINFKFPLGNICDLTPSLKEIEKAADVLYFLNLIIYDTDGRRFFKQQEINLYRGPERPINLLLKEQ